MELREFGLVLRVEVVQALGELLELAGGERADVGEGGGVRAVTLRLEGGGGEGGGDEAEEGADAAADGGRVLAGAHAVWSLKSGARFARRMLATAMSKSESERGVMGKRKRMWRWETRSLGWKRRGTLPSGVEVKRKKMPASKRALSR